MSFRVCLLAGLALLVGMAGGCGSGGPKTPIPASNEEGLKELATVFDYIEKQRLPQPRRVEDLSNYFDAIPNAFSRVQTGEYVVVWGARMTTAAPGSGGLLAYEKKAASEGGAVLLRDGTVKTVSAEEFKAAQAIK